MPDKGFGWWETVLTLAAKLWPGILGSLVALRWLPAESTRLDRAISGIGGFGAASTVGPMIAEIAGVNSVRIEAGIVFVVGLFGMAVVGEIMRAMKEIGLGSIISAWIRRILGVQ